MQGDLQKSKPNKNKIISPNDRKENDPGEGKSYSRQGGWGSPEEGRSWELRAEEKKELETASGHWEGLARALSLVVLGRVI